MHHIFISYSRKDIEFTRQLRERLQAEGFEIWMDENDIEVGTSFFHEIEEGIDTCAAFMVVMSPRSNASDNVKLEIHHAKKRQKPIFPVLLEGEEFFELATLHYADMRAGRTTVLPRSLVNRIEAVVLKGVSVNDLLALLCDRNIPPRERAKAGQRLADLGDPRSGVGLRPDRLPDIDWVEVPGGEFLYQDDKQSSLPTFHISRYPITYAQFQPFLDADDGFDNDRWWSGMGVHKLTMTDQIFKFANHPRDSVNWHQAMAFCYWLTAKLGYVVRLPSDQEWEKAARGTDGRFYPWGDEYVFGYANVDETIGDEYGDEVGPYFVQCTTSVGMYSWAASPYGVQDMSGNVWEWCTSEAYTDSGPDSKRLLRGGAWDYRYSWTRATAQYPRGASLRNHNIGFRVVCATPNLSS